MAAAVGLRVASVGGFVLAGLGIWWAAPIIGLRAAGWLFAILWLSWATRPMRRRWEQREQVRKLNARFDAVMDEWAQQMTGGFSLGRGCPRGAGRPTSTAATCAATAPTGTPACRPAASGLEKG